MWLISLIAVIFCAYFLARTTANLVSIQFEGKNISATTKLPKTSEEKSEKKILTPEAYKPIIERNIFNSQEVAASAETEPKTDEVPETTEAPTGEAVPTSLKIKLLSTFSVGDGMDERSSCVMSSEGGKGGQDVYTINDEKQFAPDTKIVKIMQSRIEFLNKGKLEYVELEDFTKGKDMNVPPDRTAGATPSKGEPQQKEPGVEQKSANSFVIDRAEIDEAIANLDKLYTQVRAVPHFKEGKPNGLKLLSVRSGSIFTKLGLQRGDILQKINGSELDIKKGLEIFNQLKNENHISIEIERRGTSQTQEYEIR